MKIRWLGIFLTLLLFPAVLMATPILLGGAYLSKDYEIKPLLGLSQDRGSTWVYPDLNPASSQKGVLHSSSCDEEFCIANVLVADNMSPNGIKVYLATTQDGGSTWHYEKNNKLNGIIIQPFNVATTCNNQVCIAFASPADSSTKLLVTLTKDHGKTWVYVDTSKFPSKASEINQATCEENVCILSGGQTIMVSQDAGETWVSSNVNFLSRRPDVFDSFKCNKNICFAAGYHSYHPEYPYSPPSPSLFKSTDAGLTWTELTSFPLFVMNDHIEIKNINNIWYLLVSNQLPPNGIIYRSDDAVAFTKTVVEKPSNITQLRSMACSKDICLIDVTQPGGRVRLEISRNQGKTWSILEVFPATNGDIANITCDEKDCLAFGTAIFPDTATLFMLTSNDNWETTSFDKNIYINLPTDFKAGFISSANFSELNFISLKKKSLGILSALEKSFNIQSLSLG